MNESKPSYRPPKEDWRLIDNSPPTFLGYVKELVSFRTVARVMVRRDLIVRFRDTYFGLAWLLFKPLMMMAAMTFVFQLLAHFEQSQTAPYPLVVFCGVIPWYFFSNAIPDAMNSLRGHQPVLQKTYFPRAIIPIAAISVDAIEFFIAWLLLVAGYFWYGFLPHWQILLFPLLCLQLLILCISVGMLLAVVNLQFRDIGNLIPFLLTIGFFVTPVGYTLSQVPETWRFVYSLNPLVGVIEGIRWSLLRGAEGFPITPVAVSVAITLTVAIISTRYFLSTEIDLVDIA